MAYDSRRGRVVLFGGADDVQVCGDTWEWDGRRWAQVSLAGPGPRTFPAMAYDGVRQKLVLFGGNRVLFGKDADDSKFLDDTWEWDGRRWIQIDVHGPGPRTEASMTFDSRRGRIVLFGGYSRVGAVINRFGDTWEWDGVEWTRTDAPGPPPGNNVALAYDSGRGRTILFDPVRGRTSPTGGPPVPGMTWEWDGARWAENQPAAAPGRFQSVMAYDAARRTMIRFGGYYDGRRAGDTWEYDGGRWRQLHVAGPSARNHSAMVYDSRRR